jgi:hypothetical protein
VGTSRQLEPELPTVGVLARALAVVDVTKALQLHLQDGSARRGVDVTWLNGLSLAEVEIEANRLLPVLPVLPVPSQATSRRIYVVSEEKQVQLIAMVERHLHVHRQHRVQALMASIGQARFDGLGLSEYSSRGGKKQSKISARVYSSLFDFPWSRQHSSTGRNIGHFRHLILLSSSVRLVF